MIAEESSENELVVLLAWRTRLCARGLRESQERMRRAIAGHGLDFREAMSIAQSMDAAIAMLRRTASSLDRGSLRSLAEEVLAEFVRWRAAEPRTEASTNAAARFGTLVRELETLAEAESTPSRQQQVRHERANESSYPPAVPADTKNKTGFASLAALREALPPGPEIAPEPAKAEETERDPFGGKIVVARTRKGRGGKTVTMISGIRAGAARLDEIARELRQVLGCGAVAEGDRIVVQGEQQARVRSFLESHGAARIVMGT